MDFGHQDEHVDDGMLLVQANLDDMNPELVPYITDKLFEEGANDVYWVPILMKKGRPGLMLNVLAAEEKLEALEAVIFAETSTLGLRYLSASCHRLGRSFEQVETPWGAIAVKSGYHQGKLVQFAPENKECEAAADRHGVPLKTVYEEVRKRFMQQREKENARE